MTEKVTENAPDMEIMAKYHLEKDEERRLLTHAVTRDIAETFVKKKVTSKTVETETICT